MAKPPIGSLKPQPRRHIVPFREAAASPTKHTGVPGCWGSIRQPGHRHSRHRSRSAASMLIEDSRASISRTSALQRPEKYGEQVAPKQSVIRAHGPAPSTQCYLNFRPPIAAIRRERGPTCTLVCLVGNVVLGPASARQIRAWPLTPHRRHGTARARHTGSSGDLAPYGVVSLRTYAQGPP